MIQDYILTTLKGMRQRKLRNYLTILGVVIGVATIIALYSLGEGLENAVAAQFSRFGSDYLIVAPKGIRGPPIRAPRTKGKKITPTKNISSIF